MMNQGEGALPSQESPQESLSSPHLSLNWTRPASSSKLRKCPLVAAVALPCQGACLRLLASGIFSQWCWLFRSCAGDRIKSVSPSNIHPMLRSGIPQQVSYLHISTSPSQASRLQPEAEGRSRLGLLTQDVLARPDGEDCTRVTRNGPTMTHSVRIHRTEFTVHVYESITLPPSCCSIAQADLHP